MRNFDIIGSIVLTLAMMLVCTIFHLGLFGSILLMLICFLALNNRGRIRGYLYNVRHMFDRKVKRAEVKSSYERMDIE